ncbi:MAG TPA: lipoyl synthase [Bacteroidales bacterium]|nr:lipoyl synthase [Bacteroidales bacterium]HQL70862.1 lipoyl synthase [Bacteroidales bacterium]
METKHKPEWLNKKMDFDGIAELTRMLRSLKLHTVCEGARCPNISECFARSTATFMILGDVCTRNCSFCAIPQHKPGPVDPEEPVHVAEAAKQLQLKHVVVTSVTRDDLADGGATQFALTIAEIRKQLPQATIEVLIPDLKGNNQSLEIVIQANPHIINHNMETVPSVFEVVRPMGNYAQSLALLKYVKNTAPHIITKSGIMVGLGESPDEVLQVMDDLRGVKCDVMTIGQYLPPSSQHALLREYISPENFEYYKNEALKRGFRYVASSPYVRSSYNAAEDMLTIQQSQK